MPKIFKTNGYQTLVGSLISLGSLSMLLIFLFRLIQELLGRGNGGDSSGFGAFGFFVVLLSGGVAYGISYIYYGTTKVTFEDKFMIISNFLRSDQIDYSNIQDVTVDIRYLKIKTNNEVFRIYKQMTNYLEFFEEFHKRTKSLQSEQFSLPISVARTDRNGNMGWMIAIFILMFFLTVISVVTANGGPMVLVIGLAIMEYKFWRIIRETPLGFDFDENAITIHDNLNEKIYRPDQIRVIKFLENKVSVRGFSQLLFVLIIEFTDGRIITLNYDEVDYPIEQLYFELKNFYKI